MPDSKRQMTLIGFLQAQNCSLLTASWRHPQSRTDFLSPEYYQAQARALEAAQFQLAFFDDRLAIPDQYGDDHRYAVQHGIRPVKLDPIPVLCAMAAVTKHIGLGATYSTTYYEPFHVARLFQTLDHMTGGRAAWNVVTSLNSSEAKNFGHESHLEHDLRYDRADEFMEVVKGLWQSWEPDAVKMDKANRIFADPAKVHAIDHVGPYFKSRGPLPVPASPQHHPVIIQAGQSGRGGQFAARWAELIFCLLPNLEVGKQTYKRTKDLIASAGRDSERVRIAPAAYVVVGESREEAKEKIAQLEQLTEEIDGLVLLSENLSYDFSRKPVDEPFSGEELDSLNGLRALRDKVLLLSKKSNPSLRDFINFSRKGTVHEHILFSGSAVDVADQMEQWFTERACDGFVIAATQMPGSFEDFGRRVTPELQRRGLLQKSYAGKTLRENLDIPLPAPRAKLAVEATGVQRRAVLGLGAAIAVGASMPREARAQGDLRGLHDAAKREGRVTYYCSQPPAMSERVIAAFKAKYPGVEVDLLRLSTAPLGRRFETEASAGTNTCDVLQLADPLLATSASQKGWLKPLTDLPAHRDFPAAFKTVDWAMVRIDPHTITYNSQLVKGADIPKGWADLVDPKWKGKMLCPDLRISVMLINWATLMIDTFGAKYLTQIAAQSPRWTPSQIPGSQLLAAGEAHLLFPNQKQVTQSFIESGAPIVDVIPAPFAGHEGVVAVPAKAPHPSAAALLANFIMSREGAEFLNKGVSYSPLPNVAGALPLPASYRRLQPQEVLKRQAEVQDLLGIK